MVSGKKTNQMQRNKSHKEKNHRMVVRSRAPAVLSDKTSVRCAYHWKLRPSIYSSLFPRTHTTLVDDRIVEESRKNLSMEVDLMTFRQGKTWTKKC